MLTQPVAVPIEVKNLRDWIYPSSQELYQLLWISSAFCRTSRGPGEGRRARLATNPDQERARILATLAADAADTADAIREDPTVLNDAAWVASFAALWTAVSVLADAVSVIECHAGAALPGLPAAGMGADDHRPAFLNQRTHGQHSGSPPGNRDQRPRSRTSR